MNKMDLKIPVHLVYCYSVMFSHNFRGELKIVQIIDKLCNCVPLVFKNYGQQQNREHGSIM